MYMGRAHPLYHGCYITKISYLRHGENSFQDQFYRPWYQVDYYRYLRFFPEGKMLMLTTPDEPHLVRNMELPSDASR
jgi:F-box protein 9